MNRSSKDNSIVVLLSCSDYDYARVKEKIDQGISLLGGWPALVKPGERVLLKPNLLAPEPPERAVTTHPAVFKAVAEGLIQHGIKPAFGDSPAISTPEKAAARAGLMAAAEELGLPLADFRQGQNINFKGHFQERTYVLARAVTECDAIISLPKMKTHGLTQLTGAVKNQFGCVVGFNKGAFHAKLPRVEDFARMLVDLDLYLHPRVYVMDGIVLMEGNGPRGGIPRRGGILIMSTDPVALDATMCRLAGVAPEKVPTVKYGAEAGLGWFTEDKITVLGDSLKELKLPGGIQFRSSRSLPIRSTWWNNAVNPRPQIQAESCISCGLCINSCPLRPTAVNWPGDAGENAPVYDYNRCIRCYCCQELCPEGAIDIYTPWAGRTLKRMSRGRLS
ncbi:MAG: DUF362 domain-containing protein [Deltaproteobacteria bacterium]